MERVYALHTVSPLDYYCKALWPLWGGFLWYWYADINQTRSHYRCSLHAFWCDWRGRQMCGYV